MTLEVLGALWCDVNKITDTEWDEIEEIGRELRELGAFKGDPIKCCIAAFVAWLDCKTEPINYEYDSGLN